MDTEKLQALLDRMPEIEQFLAERDSAGQMQPLVEGKMSFPLTDIRDRIAMRPNDHPNFHPYKYQPYPRMMKDEDGKPLRKKNGEYVIVKNEFEERQFLGKSTPKPSAATVSIPTEMPVAESHVEAAEVASLEPAKRRGRPPNPAKLPADLT